MGDHKKFNVNIDAIIKNPEGRFLILHQDGKWKLPGGRMEEGETPEACLKREVREETGISNIVIDSPVHVGLSSSGNTMLVTMRCSTSENQEVKLSDEHDQYAWVDTSSIDQYEFSFPALIEIIRRAQRGK